MGLSASQARLLTLTARMSDLELRAQQISNSKIRLAVQGEQIAKDYANALDKQKLTVLTGYSQGNAQYGNLTFDLLTGPDSPLLTQYCLTDNNGKVLVTQDIANKFRNSSSLNEFLKNCGVVTDSTSDEHHCGNNTTTSTTPTTSASSGSVDYYTNLYNKMKEGYFTVSNEDDTINNSSWTQYQIMNGNLLLDKVVEGKWQNASWRSDSSIVEETDDADTAKAEANYTAANAEIQVKDKQFDLELKNIDTEHEAVQTEVDSVKKVIDKNIERSFKMFQA